MNVLFTEPEIKIAIRTIANRIVSKQLFQEEPSIFICILNGAFMFFSDLVKQVENCEIDFMRVKSYNNEKQGDVIYILKDIENNVNNKHVYLVDDIYDSGNTISYVKEHISKHDKPLSITPVTLFKRNNKTCDELIFGIELKDETFISGYGLDGDKGLNRNLPWIVGEINDMN